MWHRHLAESKNDYSQMCVLAVFCHILGVHFFTTQMAVTKKTRKEMHSAGIIFLIPLAVSVTNISVLRFNLLLNLKVKLKLLKLV